MFVVALIGCGQVPAEVKFAGEENVTVYTTDAVAPNAATVLDKEGKALETQPALTWTVAPDSVAKLEADKIVPVASGKATVKACAGEVCKEYGFVVALPDKVVVTGADGVEFKVGTEVQLAAKVMSGEIEVPGQTVAFTIDNATIATVDAAGKVMPLAAGAATITATAGALTATVPLNVVAGDAAAVPPTN